MHLYVSSLGITHDEAIRLAGVLIWPVVVVVLAITFRRALIAFVEGTAGMLKGSLSKVSLPGGFAFELVQTHEFKVDWSGPGGEDLRNTVGITQFASGVQDILGLLKPQQPSLTADYAVFNLGLGEQWLTSRLHLFSLLLRRTHGLRYCVFVFNTPDVRRRYLGFATTEAVRWSMALSYPFLEQAAHKALLQLNDERITSHTGALDPQSATSFINNYLSAIQIDLALSTDNFVPNTVAAFARSLRENAGLAQFLKSQLPTPALAELNKGPTWPSQLNQCANALNDIMEKQPLYDETRFSGVSLSEQAKGLLSRKPEGDDRILVNRLLLYEAFPTCVTPFAVPPGFTSFNDGQWVKLETRDMYGNVRRRWEHARWLDRISAERFLGPDLGRAQVSTADLQKATRKDQVSIILRSEGPMVAAVGDGGRFERLIDRLALASRAIEFSL